MNYLDIQLKRKGRSFTYGKAGFQLEEGQAGVKHTSPRTLKHAHCISQLESHSGEGF